MRVFLRTNAAKLRRRETADQRCVAHRPDAQGPDRPARRAAGVDERRDGRSHRRGRPRRRCARHRRRHPLNVQARKGVLLAAGGFATTRICAAGTAATSPTTASGRSRTPATPAKCCRRRWTWAPRPTCWTRPGGCQWFSLPTPAPRRSAPDGSGRARSTSTGPAGGSATSRTPTSRSARRCTPTRPCRAGRSSTRATSAGMCRAPTR